MTTAPSALLQHVTKGTVRAVTHLHPHCSGCKRGPAQGQTKLATTVSYLEAEGFGTTRVQMQLHAQNLPTLNSNTRSCQGLKLELDFRKV